MKFTKIVLVIIIFIQLCYSETSKQIYTWVNLNIPVKVTFGENSFPAISTDINLAFNRNLFKISYLYGPAIFDDLLLSDCSLSYGYIFNKDRFIFNPNVSFGIVHYYSDFIFANQYERIECIKPIVKLSFYCHYVFTNSFNVGIFFNPLIVGPASGYEDGLVFTFGNLWKYHNDW